MMKVYISGKISGLPIEEVKRKFHNAASLLGSLDLQPVNPLENGLQDGATWAQHMGKDIELLLGCDAILMLDNWKQSRGADIERTIAKKLDMAILYEEIVADDENKRIAGFVEDAVQQVTGFSLKQFAQRSRCREMCYARMIFVYHCRRMKMRLVTISKFVHRDHTTMLHYLNKYNDEVRFNKEFRDLANKVVQKLKENEIRIKKPKQD